MAVARAGGTLGARAWVAHLPTYRRTRVLTGNPPASHKTPLHSAARAPQKAEKPRNRGFLCVSKVWAKRLIRVVGMINDVYR